MTRPDRHDARGSTSATWHEEAEGTRAERRAEAVKRLRALGDVRHTSELMGYVPTAALYAGDIDRYMDSDVETDRLLLIDLLSEDVCHNTVDDDWGTFECSECGTQWEVSPVYIGPSGTSDHDLVIPNHCPNCGAKVVRK